VAGVSIKDRLNQFAHWQRRSLRYRLLNPVRYAADNARMALEPNVTGGAYDCRILLVSDAQIATSEEQLNPFSLYRSDLRRQLKIVSMHLLLQDVLRLPKVALRSFDIIALKLSFRLNEAEVSDIKRGITEIAGNRPVIYLDGDDDICIMRPEILSWVGVYVKKHIFRDRSQYLQCFVGKSNLTDFVHREYNYSFADNPHAKESRPVDRADLGKIMVGWNVALDSNIVKLFTSVTAHPQPMERNVDVMFRGNVPKDWLHYLRKDIEPSLKRLQSSFNVIIPTERVSRDEYYREMTCSKICVSPFGYGEICWRDLEAVMCGCLLIKPDMSHVETVPNIFIANETYVPVRWNYADLEEKCSYYLRNEDERKRIVSAASQVLADYYRRKGFLTSVCEILNRVRRRGSFDQQESEGK
jgi:hypothetical protein